jgi:Flp pilus assembly protein TadB
VDADFREAGVAAEVDLGDASMLPEGGLELLEAAYLIRLTRERGLQIELERDSPTLRRPVRGRADPLGRVMVMVVTMTMIVVVMTMVVTMTMVVVMAVVMVMIAGGAVHMLHDEPLPLLARIDRGQPHQLPELLRLRHVASC